MRAGLQNPKYSSSKMRNLRMGGGPLTNIG